jgi:8-oxo-dGTP diphosphatase
MPASEQGTDRKRYMLVPRTLIFLTRNDEILLLKGAHDKRLWADQYNGVGGHIEQGEDTLSAARREVLEETGLILDDLWLCGTITVDTQTNPGVCIFVYRGEYKAGEPGPSKEGTLEWVKAGEINHLPLVRDLSILLPKILKMRQTEAPFSAHSQYNDSGELVITFAN